MPIHKNKDGTWQWGKSGKKYKKRKDAIRQMKAIFANGYVEKHASYSDVLGMIKQAKPLLTPYTSVFDRPKVTGEQTVYLKSGQTPNTYSLPMRRAFGVSGPKEAWELTKGYNAEKKNPVPKDDKKLRAGQKILIPKVNLPKRFDYMADVQGSPSAYISSVLRKNPAKTVFPMLNPTDPQQLKRHILWKGLGWDDPKKRQKDIRDAYFRTLHFRQSSNNPNLIRRYKEGPKKGQVFAAGIGSMQQSALDVAKKLGLLGKRTTLVDLADKKNHQRTKQAIQGVQDYYNRPAPYIKATSNRQLSFAYPKDIYQMYNRYNNGPQGAQLITANLGGRKLSEKDKKTLQERLRNIAAFRRDFKNLHPLFAPLMP